MQSVNFTPVGTSTRSNEHCSEVFSEANKIHNALFAITKEIESFHHATTSKKETQNVFNIIIKYKARNNKLKKETKRLNQNIKIFYVLAKLLLSKNGNGKIIAEKSNAAKAFKNPNIFTLSDFESQLIGETSFAHNNIINEEETFDKSLDDIFSQDKLNRFFIDNIFYINYCDKHERKEELLKQKNRFLENTLTSLRDDVNDLHYEISRPQKEKYIYMNKVTKSPNLDNNILAEIEDCYSINKSENVFRKLNDLTKETPLPYLNLKPHLAVVKNLLDDQNNMLQELKKISEDILSSHIKIRIKNQRNYDF